MADSDGELEDFEAVDAVAIRESVPGMSLVTFVGARLNGSRRSD
jgi:hypothetical protein